MKNNTKPTAVMQEYARLHQLILDKSQAGFRALKLLRSVILFHATISTFLLLSDQVMPGHLTLLHGATVILAAVVLRYYTALQGQIYAFHAGRLEVGEDFIIDVSIDLGLSGIEVNRYMPRDKRPVMFSHVYLMVWDVRQRKRVAGNA